MLKEWLTQRLTIEEAEAAYPVRDERLGPDVVPFGFMNDDWRKLLEQMTPGDELWEFASSPESWAKMAGRSGIALVREGEIVDSIITMMN